MVTKRFLEDNILCDKIVYHRKEGTFTFERMFFYTHGRTDEDFRDDIIVQLKKNVGVAFKIVDYFERWQAFPKDSYFGVEVRFGG